MKYRVAFICMLGVVGGCSSSSNGGSASPEAPSFCTTVVGGSTNVRTTGTCTGCGAENRGQAIDNELATAATLSTGAGSPGGIALEATTQSGIVYAAGTTAGFVVSMGDESLVTVRTRLDDAPQEDSQSAQMTETSGGLVRVFFETSAPFNSIEAVLPGDGAVDPLIGEARSVSVFEYCAQ